MSNQSKTPGTHMAAEIAQAPDVFSTALAADYSVPVRDLGLTAATTFYTIARGSSDAAANVLSYEMMQHLALPVTSLPPSTFSLFDGVALDGATGIVISQSGASDDLVRAARGIKASRGNVIAITNQANSPVSKVADLSLPIMAGPELAVPATKTVIGSIAAGMALIRTLKPEYADVCAAASMGLEALKGRSLPQAEALKSALLRADHIFFIGRGAGYGAAQEIALKVKETAALHSEPYSASEVLHGPLQLATNPLLAIILDTGAPETQTSLDAAEARFRDIGSTVFRIRPDDVGDDVSYVGQAAAAAQLLYLFYPVILSTALALGFDPDAPAALSKVTQTT